MMKKIFTMIALAMFLAPMVISCGGGAGSLGPAKTELKIWNEFKAGNYEKGMTLWIDNLLPKENKEMTAEQKKEFVKAFAQKAEEEVQTKNGGIKSVDLVSEEIAEDGLSAKVTVHVVFNNGTEEDKSSKYVKQDGNWYIDNNK